MRKSIKTFNSWFISQILLFQWARSSWSPNLPYKGGVTATRSVHRKRGFGLLYFLAMPLVTYIVTCTRKRQLTPDVWEFAFTKPDGFAYKAGQFVLFDVPLIGNESDVQPRAYSMASASHEDELLFILKMIPTGRASRWFLERIDVGATLPMKGPFGMFTVNPTDAKHLLMIGTGTGVAPFRSQIETLKHAKDARHIDLVFGVRKEEDLFWVEMMEEIAKKHGNASLHIALTQPSAAWTGLRGRVQTVVPTVINDFSGISLFACGSPPMTRDVKALALGEWKMEKKDVHVEGYI